MSVVGLTPNPLPKTSPLNSIFDKPLLQATRHVEIDASWWENHTAHLSANRTVEMEVYGFQRDRVIPAGSTFEGAIALAGTLTDGNSDFDDVPYAVLDAGDGTFALSMIGGVISDDDADYQPALPKDADQQHGTAVDYDVKVDELTRLEPLNPALKAVVFSNGWFDLRTGAVDATVGAKALTHR
jgi:hypothetical protein